MTRRRNPRRLETRLRRALIRFCPAVFLRLCQPRRSELGEVGEELAARYLRAAGWRVVGRRVQTPYGEIDLVAQRSGVCACVEVKTGRRTESRAQGAGHDPFEGRWRPGDRLGPRQLQRQRRAARWLARAREEPRVDLVEVLLMPTAPRLRIRHHPGLTRPLRRAPGGEGGGLKRVSDSAD